MVFLEVFAYFIRLFSLGLRLSANMITGHILTKVCINFIWLGLNKLGLLVIIPLLFLTLFLSLEILIAYLQAYIFTFITCITFRDLI